MNFQDITKLVNKYFDINISTSDYCSQFMFDLSTSLTLHFESERRAYIILRHILTSSHNVDNDKFYC